ncbi:MAG: acylphosphatase [Gemmatimonas sp.]
MNAADEIDAVHVRIHGRVQGVFFRKWIVQEATKRALRGWVRNRSDGTVEAVFVGPRSVLREMVAACRKGPPKAEVSRVIEIPGEYAPDEDETGAEFLQMPTV